MKKMQCEVCGSHEIRKIDDATFACQSCGVQYDKAEVQKLLVEVTGSVKIDHSDEVDNHIKRAEQFEEAGNLQKASDHYNAALDLDATNTTAQDKVQDLSKKSQYENFYIVDAHMTDADVMDAFLHELAATENIACDIYKEIDIQKVSNTYRVFGFLKGTYKCNWSATICHREYVNETVYKDRYDPNTRKSYKEPTTQKVEHITRHPASGERVYNAEQLLCACDPLKRYAQPYNAVACESMSVNFEELQNAKYGSYNVQRLNAAAITEQDGTVLYKGIPVDFTVDQQRVATRKKEITDLADQQCCDHIIANMGGDFHENLSATKTVVRESMAYVCIPVQIIEYTYKSQSYYAICDLVSRTTTISKLYPCDSVLNESRNALSANNADAQSWPAEFAGGIFFEVVGFICLVIASMAKNGDTAGIMGVAFLVVGLIMMLVGVVKRGNKQKQFAQQSKEAKSTIYNPRNLALSHSYEAFFAVLDNNGSINDAKNAIPDIMSVEDTFVQISEAGDFKEFSVANDADTDKEETVIDEKSDELLKLQQQKKVPIILITIGLIAMSILGPLLGAVGVVFMLAGVVMLIIGVVKLSKINKAIAACDQELQALRDTWLKN